MRALSNPMRRRALAGLLGVLGTPVCAWSAASSHDGPVVRRLRFSMTLANPFPHALQQQALFCYVPAEAPPSQQLQSLQVSHPYRIEQDALGHRILALRFETVAPFARIALSWTAAAVLRPDVPGAAALEKPAPWLAPAPWIESDSLAIRQLAASLGGAAPRERARAIYDWVRSNLRYAGYVADERGAAAALRDRTGDCTEYADLVAALARASGIPARMVGGYVVQGDAAPHAQDYHNWAELHLDGAWRVVDSQKEAWLPPEGQYVAFHFHGAPCVNNVGDAHRYRIQGELAVTA